MGVDPQLVTNLKCLCRFHQLLKTFWAGALGWHDRQHPDGTVEWRSPTGHAYRTEPNRAASCSYQHYACPPARYG